MLLKTTNGLSFFTFSKFNAFNAICHGIFTRDNGYSKNDYKSLNIGLSVEDELSAVEKNRTAISAALSAQSLCFARQVHETNILIFRKSVKAELPITNDEPDAADAMITDIAGKFLVIQVADCQAVLLYDPENKVVANIHSGWRGSVQNIIGKCVSAMVSEFGCRPENMVAGVSPSLGACCAEFIHYQQEIPKKYWSFKTPDHYFNFWEISRRQLQNAGLLNKNIEISNICSKCNSHLFYSYRKTRVTGRFAAVIGLK